MTNVADLLNAAGDKSELARECKVAPIAVYRWATSGSIPAKHHAGVLRVAKRNGADLNGEPITAEMLVGIHDPKRDAEDALTAGAA